MLETSATEAAQEARAGRQLSAPQVTLHQHYSSLCQLSFHVFTEKNRVSLSLQLIPASGLKKRADRAKARKTIPPMIVTKEGERETFLLGRWACSM